MAAVRTEESETDYLAELRKEQSAMQRPWCGPQTRSTATALAVALQEQHNAVHETSARFAFERTEA